jgi:hypothetical protein
LSISGTGVTWSPSGRVGSSAVTLAGTGELTTASTVFNTRSSAGFTVAAWVRLPAPPAADGSAPIDPEPQPEPEPGTGDDPDDVDSPSNEEQEDLPSPLPATNQVAVSQDGVNTSMFRLGYRADLDLDGDSKPDPAWCFTVAAKDQNAAATTDACSGSYVEAGSWVHLVGIVTIDNRIQLYVNGLPANDGVLAERTGTATWEATGRFAVGRGLEANAADDRWAGEIDEVNVTPRVWTDLEILNKSRVPDDATS